MVASVAVQQKYDNAKIAWEVIALIATIIGILVSIALQIWQYESRYDHYVGASGAIEISFSAGHNVGANTMKASAGNLYYGIVQKSGTTPTEYKLYYKASSSPYYTVLKEAIYCFNLNNPVGDYPMLYSSSTGFYDFKAERKNNLSTDAVLEVDWGVY